MNLVTNNQNNNTLKMTSLQIADLTNKRHDNVKTIIKDLVNTGVIRLPEIEEVKNHLNQTVTHYVFEGEQGERDSIVVVARLSPEFTGKIVDRWRELEQQLANPQPVLPATYIEALEALVSSEKQKLEVTYQLEEAKKEIAVAAPKVDHFDITMNSDKTTKASTVAGYLGIGVQTLNDILDHKGWYYKKTSGKAREFKQHIVTSGYGRKLQIKYNVQQSVFTAKGIAEIVALLKTDEGKALIDRFEPKSEKLARARQARKEAKEALKSPAREEHTQDTIIRINTLLKQA